MDYRIIIWILMGVFGLFGLIFAVSKKKKVMEKSKWLFAIPFFLVAFLLLAWNVGWLTNLVGLAPLSVGGVQISPPPSGGGQQQGDLCATEDTTVTLSSVNKYTSASAGTTHRYRINGAPALTVSNAGTFTASPGDTINVLWGNETDGSYYGAVGNYVVPCAGTKTFSVDLVQNGTLTMNVYTEGGDQIDGSAYNETLGAGDTATLKIEIHAENKKGYPHGGVLTLELNGTEYDEENTALEFEDLAVTELASSPNVHTVSNVANKLVSWYIPPIEGTTLHIGSITLDVDSSYDPGEANDPVLTFRPYDYFVNEDNGGAFEGPIVEDEDNSATFKYAPTKTISVM